VERRLGGVVTKLAQKMADGTLPELVFFRKHRGTSSVGGLGGSAEQERLLT